MPNLTTTDVRAWLGSTSPAIAAGEWPPPIRMIEDSHDHPDLLASLGTALDHGLEADASRIAALLTEAPGLAQLRPILAQFGAARLLRILHWSLEADLGDAHRLTSLLTASNDHSARALRAALSALALRSAIDRVFSPERVSALEAACAPTEQEAA